MRFIGVKYRSRKDPLYRGSWNDLQEILETIQGASYEGLLEVTIPIHPSDLIKESLIDLGYTLQELQDGTGIKIIW